MCNGWFCLPFSSMFGFEFLRMSFDKTKEYCVFKMSFSCLGGGFNYFLFFSPKIGEDVQFDEHISDGLKPPTRNDDVLLFSSTPKKTRHFGQPRSNDVRLGHGRLAL